MTTRKKTTKGSTVDCACDDTPVSSRYWVELIGMLAFIMIAAKFWSALGLESLIPHSAASTSLPAILLVGFIAATSSCLAIVGGLLLSISAAWAEQTEGKPTWVRLQPMLLFNAGRLGGYFLFGGFVGLLGKALNPGGQVTGYLTIILSLVMIGLALRILKLMPAAYCRIPMPGKVQKRLMKLSKSNHPVVAVILGALTFFVPCGFTQSVQLLALGSGGFLSGAVMMFVFALGTLPALLSISLLSSVVRGKTARVFFLFSGALVLLLGLNNLQSGLLLTGVDAKGFVEKSLFSSSRDSVGNDPYVTIDEKGQQIIAMYVTPQGYKPDHFTVKKGLTTWIYAIADVPPSGCANFMQIPTYGVGNTIIKQGGNWVGPIVTSQDFVVTCSMGMYRATVTVQE